MNNKVYFAGSIRGGRADAELYQRIIDYIKLKDEVLTEHIGKTTISLKQQTRIIDSHIYERDVNWLESCDMVIAECSNASLGVGYELAYAEAHDIPVFAFYNKKTSSLSAMINGNRYFNIIPYETEDEIYFALDRILENNYKYYDFIDQDAVITGNHGLDYLLHGWHKGELTLLMGKPAQGKTGFTLRSALNISTEHIPSVYFSLEMDEEAAINRMACMKDTKRIKNAKKKIKKYPLVINDKAGISIEEIINVVRKSVIENKTRIIYIDYVQLLNVNTGVHSKERVDELKYIFSVLKQLALELEISIVAVAQESFIPSWPQHEDFYKDIDTLMFIDYPEYYHVFTDENGVNLLDQNVVSIVKHQENNVFEKFYYNFMTDTCTKTFIQK